MQKLMVWSKKIGDFLSEKLIKSQISYVLSGLLICLFLKELIELIFELVMHLDLLVKFFKVLSKRIFTFFLLNLMFFRTFFGYNDLILSLGKIFLSSIFEWI